MMRIAILAVVGFVVGIGGAVGIVIARSPDAPAADVAAAADSSVVEAEDPDAAPAPLPAPIAPPTAYPAAADSLAERDALALDSIRALTIAAAPAQPNADAAAPAAPGPPERSGPPVVAVAGGPQHESADAAATLSDHRIGKIFATMQPRDAARILDQMSDHDIAVILGMMGDRQAAAVLSALPPRRAAEIGQRSIRDGRGPR
jgi:hypothetical protein